LRRRIVAAVAGVGVQAVDRGADELLDAGDDCCQRMAVRAWSPSSSSRVREAVDQIEGPSNRHGRSRVSP
jgi:hypothetical protein